MRKFNEKLFFKLTKELSDKTLGKNLNNKFQEETLKINVQKKLE